MKKTTKRNIIIAAVILCVIVAALFLISISFDLFRTTADQKNMTTDTWSHSFASKEEKLSFLTEYLIAPSEILDAEYHIISMTILPVGFPALLIGISGQRLKSSQKTLVYGQTGLRELPPAMLI
jgi:TRAP-type C4-dicarboxylate transport system permease small subunit